MATDGKDFYTILGVPRSASTDQLRRAYRQAALELHPDRNEEPGDTELFLRISQAYETLTDPESRRAYDQQLAEEEERLAEESDFTAIVRHSRKTLLQLDEPQVHYVLLEISPRRGLGHVRPPVNLSIVIDRSTSMKGQRLDQVRSATQEILLSLQPYDTASVVAFSDRAEVIVSPDQAKDISVARARMSLLQADGGTEIGQGLQQGIDEIQKYFTRDGVNHLVLLTDGRTYGDEDECIAMARSVADRGITINGVGIGSDWSDRFLDELATITGGNVLFLDSPKSITGLLEGIMDNLSKVIASRMKLDGSLSQSVDLRSAFRLEPEPMGLGDTLPLALGNLSRGEQISLLLEIVIHPLGKVQTLTLAHLNVAGDLLGESAEPQPLPIHLELPVAEAPDKDPPPEKISEALSAIALYRMQDKARHEAELGQSGMAARRLETLATQLLANGERDLAKAALHEAENLGKSRRLSTEGEKRLKYGTRALLLPARTSASDDEDD
ncbi:MAG: DnaJ domain-containing protein [Anaerolineales bacterium]